VRKIAPRKFKGKVCRFCVERIDTPNFREVNILRRYISDRGKIVSSRTTGTCAYHQRKLAIALKRARHLALLPFTTVRP